MTRAQDLANWLVATLPIKGAYVESPINEDHLPGAIVHYQGAGPGDTLDPTLVTEVYQVALVGEQVGAQPVQTQTDIAALERAIATTMRSSARASVGGSNRWDYITATLTQADRQAGISLWQFTLWVRGE
jgi:hypothetical protein